MCSALAHDDSLNFRAAFGTCFTLSTIDAKVVLVIAASVDPIQAGAMTVDSLLQREFDGIPEGFYFGVADLIRRMEGVDAGVVERFVGVNITQSSQE